MRAVIFVPSWADLDTHKAACVQIADELGVSPTGIVRQWGDVVHLIKADLLDLTLVATRAHLPPERTPRVVAPVDLATTSRPTHRRPRRL